MGVMENMQLNWRPDSSAPLWDAGDEGEAQGPFFADLELEHLRQVGPTCVPTTLAMIARATGANVGPEDFMPLINSQSPHSWSEALKPYGLQLAYCNFDLRRLEHYIDELVEMNDLFVLCFYSTDPPYDPEVEGGKLCTAHIVTLHEDRVIDTARGGGMAVVPASDYDRSERQTKRIFRVVPEGYQRSV
jgi:hypothetical protein